MTRKKVKLAYINNDSSRKATFKKRKKGLLKKVSELSTLCAVDACAIIYSPYEAQPAVFPSTAGVNRILARFKKMPEIEQSKKMVNQEAFLKQKIGKVNEQVKKLRKENREKEMNRLMYSNLCGKTNLLGLTVTDLNDLTWLIDQNLKDINKRIENVAKNTTSARMAAAAATAPVVNGNFDGEVKANVVAPMVNVDNNGVNGAVQRQQWRVD
ncbi:agamous-like MADS-box protein AGL80 isoform X1 [Humulus lupulus]|uniref:agamous-like MADS-box protein AGL80 isoform X1 n=1 Tax=Humulus lupulus TaxID=3486 RepID=UPI002B411DF4|nr:agamous-like MADS-box protein AGL80 isoform X1 [Humulus lupulus]